MQAEPHTFYIKSVNLIYVTSHEYNVPELKKKKTLYRTGLG